MLKARKADGSGSDEMENAIHSLGEMVAKSVGKTKWDDVAQ
jgi:hypothetical protein